MLAVQFNPNDSMASVGELFGGTPLVAVILVVAAIAIGANNALNFYGSMLNLITAVTSFRPVGTSVRIRAVMLEPTFVIGLLVALTASADFSTKVGVLLSFLLLGFVP